MKHGLFLLLVSILGFETRSPGGELQLAKVFADRAVLQRGVPLPIWGWARPNSEVSVEFSGERASTVSNAEGRWRLELKSLETDAEGKALKVASADESIVVSDLLVGEIWLASGQSNMEMTMAACAKKLDFVESVIAEPESRPIRTLRIDSPDTKAPLSDLADEVRWQLDNAANRPRQSAVAYFFAREIYDRLQVPIGIIEGSWGGKPIEGFIPREAFSDHEVLERIVTLADEEELEALAESEGGVMIRNTAGRPGRIYNARVAPVAPYAIAGFLWYQGESNAGKGEDPRFYKEKMAALVNGWRKDWANSNLPFYFVQLPSYKDSATGWVRLREEQRLSLETRNTGMAVTIDLRDQDIHPANKVDVGRRLAAWALAKTYGEDFPFSGPLFRSATRENGEFRIAFDQTGTGLMIARKEGLADPVEEQNSKLGSFEIADPEGNWFPAGAKIVGDEVLVSSDRVTAPAAVRYACEGEAENANLYNREGFPASPFCSDLEFLPWIKQP